MSVESYLCIDISTNSIKALEKDSGGKVARWGILERKKEFHSSIRPIDPADAAPALAELLGKMEARSKSAVFSLPAFYLFTAVADVVDPQLVPALPATYKLSAWPMRDGRYFFEAIPLEVTERYKEICRLSGLRFAGAVSESEALAITTPRSSGRVLVVNVDDRLTTFVLINGGSVEYVLRSDFGRASEALDIIPHIENGVIEKAPPGSYVWDVIMNKTREVAGKTGAEEVLFSNSVFNIANGLPKISQQAFNGYGFSWSIRSAY